MTEREKVLLRREGAMKAFLHMTPINAAGCWSPSAQEKAAKLFPLPTRTVPTVRRGTFAKGAWWYRCVSSNFHNCLTVGRYRSREDALVGEAFSMDWVAEDQPTVAALLALPLTEQVEDTGEDGAK